MAQNQVHVAAGDDVPAIIEHLRRVPGEDVQLVLPMNSRFGQSRFNFQLLKQYSTRLGKRVAIVSADPAVQRIAEESGFTAHRGGGQEGRPLEAPPRPAPVPMPSAPPPPAPLSPDPPPTRRIGAVSPSSPPTRLIRRPAEMAAAGAGAAAAAGPMGGPAAAATAAPMPSRLGSIGRIAHEVPQGAARIRIAAPTRLPSKLGTQFQLTRTMLYGGAAILLLAGIIAMLFYVPSAQVTLIADAKPFAQDFEFTGEPGKIPVHVRTQAASMTETLGGTASGVKTEPGQVAGGQFTYVNQCPGQTFQISNGQRLRTASGVVFAQLGDVVLPQGQTATVSIKAVAPGVSGNVGVGQINQIELNPMPCLTGANQAPTGGGVDEQKKTAIQESDIQTVQARLESDLRQKIGDELQKQLQKGEKLVVGPAQSPSVNTDHSVDDEVQNFSMTMTMKLEGDFYQSDDVVQQFTRMLAQKIPTDQQLTSNRITVDPQVTSSGGGHLDFKGRPSGYTAPRIDLEGIPGRIAGKPAGQARTDLARLPVRSVQIKQSPFSLPLMPMSSSRIHVEYDVAAGPAAPSG